MMQAFLVIVLLSLIAQLVHSFPRIGLSTQLRPPTSFPKSATRPSLAKLRPKTSSSALQMLMLPQIGFVATCVAAIVTYIYLNIDEIKQKQQSTIDKAMVQQSTTIKDVQEAQRIAIEKARLQQQENTIRAQKMAEEARKRASGK